MSPQGLPQATSKASVGCGMGGWAWHKCWDTIGFIGIVITSHLFSCDIRSFTSSVQLLRGRMSVFSVPEKQTRWARYPCWGWSLESWCRLQPRRWGNLGKQLLRDSEGINREFANTRLLIELSEGFYFSLFEKKYMLE